MAKQTKTARLKKALLKCAVEGKLVAQIASEGSAAKLLEDIQKEKQRLVAKGKAKPAKPQAVIKPEEIPFAIPKSWVWVRLGEIVSVNPRNSIDNDLQVSFLPMTNIDPGYSNSFTQSLRSWGSVKASYTHLKENDVIFAKITPCFQNLKSCILTNLKNGFGAGTTELHVLRDELKILNLKYLLYFVKSDYFIDDGKNSMSGTAGQQRVGADFVKNFLIPLPPLKEQQRIVQKLESLLKKCDQLEVCEKQLASLENSFEARLKKALLKHAVEGKLVAQIPSDGRASQLLEDIQKEKQRLVAEGKAKPAKPLAAIKPEEIPFDIPKSWVWVRLGEVSFSYTGDSIPAEQKRQIYSKVKKGYDYIGTKDVGFDSVIAYENGVKIPFDSSFAIAPPNSVLLCIEGGSAARKIAIVDKKVCFGNKLCCFNPCEFDHKYLFYYLQSPVFLEQYYETMQGLRKGVGIEKLRSFLIPLPPLKEQQRIVQKLESLLEKCQQLSSKLGK